MFLFCNRSHRLQGCKDLKDLGGCHIFLMTKMNVISLYVPINCLHHGMDGGQTPWELNSSNFILSDSLSKGKNCLRSLIKHQHNSWFPQTQEAITFQMSAPWVARLCQWASRFKTDYVKLILSSSDSSFILVSISYLIHCFLVLRSCL